MPKITENNGVDQITPHNLAQFIGTEQYFKHWTGSIVYTDGVQYVGSHGGYWIIDLIASYQTAALIKAQPFQAWTIKRTEAGGFIATATDGNDNELIRQEGEYTDLPVDLEFFLQADPTFKAVLLLTSEY